MRAAQQDPVCYRVGDLVVDTGTRQVSRDRHRLEMPPLSFDLLVALVRSAPNALTNDQLMSQVWSGRVVNDETVSKRVELVREALGDDSRESRYIALVRGHGYRLTAPVECLDSPQGTTPAWFSGRRIGLAIGMVAAMLLAGIGLMTITHRDAAPPVDTEARRPARIRSLAVLPLENLSGQGEQEYLAAGMHDALITDLARASALKVISRTSTLPYHRSGKPLPQIARELGVEMVMEGSVFRAGNRVRITLQLINADDSHIWADSYEGDLRSVLQLQSQVARAVAEAVSITLTPLEQSHMSSSRRQVNPEAYDLYLKGSYYLDRMTPEGNEAGLALLHKATQIDPADPMPYARLASAYNRIGHAPGAAKSAYSRGTSAALKALALDDDIAEAHLALAENKLYFLWDWEEADASFTRTLQINPSIAEAHAQYAWLHLIYGRADRAMAAAKLAMELDPRQPLWISWYGWICLLLGEYESAVSAQLAALEIDPDFPVAHFQLGQAYSMLGRHEEALRASRKAAERNPKWSWGVGQSHALAGHHAEARAFAGNLAQQQHPDPWGMAEIYVALGDKDAALTWLETGYEMRRDWMPWVEANIFFKPLFDEPRFKEIVRRLNLPAKTG